MRILLIRHAEPDYSVDSLTEKGFREAELLSERLVKEPIDDFYVSPLGRAQDTIRPTLQKLHRTAETLPWLAEFRGYVYGPEGRRIPWNLAPQYWTKQPLLFEKDGWTREALMATGNCEEIYRETVEGLDGLLARYGLTRDGMLYLCEKNPDRSDLPLRAEPDARRRADRHRRAADVARVLPAALLRDRAGRRGTHSRPAVVPGQLHGRHVAPVCRRGADLLMRPVLPRARQHGAINDRLIGGRG